MRFPSWLFAFTLLLPTAGHAADNVNPATPPKDTAVRLALAQTLISVMPGPGEVRTGLVVEATNAGSLAANLQLAPPTEIVTQAATAGQVAFDTPRMLATDKPAIRKWVLPMTVKNMPASDKQMRYFSLKVGDIDWTGSFQLVSGAPVKRWSIHPSPSVERQVGMDWKLPLNILAQAAPAPFTLRLSPAQFVAANNVKPLDAGAIALCPTEEPCDGTSAQVTPPHTTLWLMMKSGPSLAMSPGKHAGTVTLVSDDKTEVENVALVLHVTSPARQAMGAACIAIGVIVAWYVTNILRQRMVRLEMMAPAVDQLAEIDSLRRRLAALKAPYTASKVLKKLRVIECDLDESALRNNGLAAPLSSWTGTSTTSIGKLNDYLGERRAALDGISIVVDEGLESVAQARSREMAGQAKWPPEAEPPFTAAWTAIDALAQDPALTSTDALRPKIAGILDTMQRAVDAVLRPGGPDTFLARTMGSRAIPRTRAHLNFLITTNNLAGWAFLLLVTVLAGVYLLILDRPDFGTMKDLFQCLFWGLGLPATATAASAATTNIMSVYRPTTI